MVWLSVILACQSLRYDTDQRAAVAQGMDRADGCKNIKYMQHRHATERSSASAAKEVVEIWSRKLSHRWSLQCWRDASLQAPERGSGARQVYEGIKDRCSSSVLSRSFSVQREHRVSRSNMGNTWSATSGMGMPSFPWTGKPEEVDEPEEFVIVPPMISMDRQEINRMAFSSYDWSHQRRELAVLLSDYLRPGVAARLNFVPPSDDRLLTSANLRLPDALRKGWAAFLSDGPDQGGIGQTWADLSVRAHVTKDDPHSFAAFVLGSNRVRPRCQLLCSFSICCRQTVTSVCSQLASVLTAHRGDGNIKQYQLCCTRLERNRE